MVDSVGIVGSGRLASTLALLLPARGVRVAAVAARSGEARTRLANRVDGATASAIPELAEYTSVALIAVSDDAIPHVAWQLANSDSALRVAIHTSGAAGPEALAELHARGTAIGVLHPLQTIPSPEAGITALPGSAFAYAGDIAAQTVAQNLVEALGGTPLPIAADRWQHYHAAAVMASNYQAALVEAALELMEAAGVQRHTALEALRPLIQQSTRNILASGPDAALTGPIRRGDLGTVVRHLLALRQAPAGVRELYAAAGLQTVVLAERAGLPAAEAQEIAKALARASVQ